MNLDEALDIMDIIKLQKYLLGVDTLDKDQAAAADLTADGDVDVFDMAMLKRTLIGNVDA